MTPKQFSELGAYVIGHPIRWQSAIARQLGVTRKCVQHWVAGRRPIPGPVALAVTLLCERKQIEEMTR